MHARLQAVGAFAYTVDFVEKLLHLRRCDQITALLTQILGAVLHERLRGRTRPREGALEHACERHAEHVAERVGERFLDVGSEITQQFFHATRQFRVA